MCLYEVTTGWIGESYERFYIWAQDDETARTMAEAKIAQFNSTQKSTQKHPSRLRRKDDLRIQFIMNGLAEPFCSDLSDCGWDLPHLKD